jgi:hypothetical protein
MKRSLLILVVFGLGLGLGLGVSCKKEATVKADVSCELIGMGLKCDIVHQAGESPARVCWTAKMTCENATEMEAKECQVVEPGAQATRKIPKARFKNLDLCDAISGVTMGKIVATAQK